MANKTLAELRALEADAWKRYQSYTETHGYTLDSSRLAISWNNAFQEMTKANEAYLTKLSAAKEAVIAASKALSKNFPDFALELEWKSTALALEVVEREGDENATKTD